MAVVRPFPCIRPAADKAAQVAALPYDVYNRKEACQAVAGNPLSFLNIDRAETQFSNDVDTYDDQVYAKAKELLNARIEDGTFVEDGSEAYYVYGLTMDGRRQAGIVACSSIDDYQNGIIKKHENTRESKELDRIRHIDETDAHTGPIFLAYRAVPELSQIVDQAMSEPELYDFTSSDGVRHQVWKIGSGEMIRRIEDLFGQIPCTYIADGHHRAASAVKVGLKRRMENPDYTGNEPFNYFLTVLFPDDQLMILPYNRVVRDLNGLTKEEFLEKISEPFLVEKVGIQAYEPEKKGKFGMYLDGEWYCLTAKEGILSDDPVAGLDPSILQDNLLCPILGIQDPKTDKRIAFIGGIRGMKELERRVSEDMAAAFAVSPVSIGELLHVADAGLLMPPKSTWFEPKLRSGLFIHRLKEI